MKNSILILFIMFAVQGFTQEFKTASNSSAIKSAIEIIENNNPRFTDLESLESTFITALEVTLEEMKLARELAIEQLKRNAED